jgi:hypothetical protein
MEYSLGQSRQWNADRRARPQRRVGASRHFRGAPRTRWCGHETLRLSAFRFLLFSSVRSFVRSSSFVIAGHSRLKNGVASLAYDPAIHAEAKHDRAFPVGLLQTARQHGQPDQVR